MIDESGRAAEDGDPAVVLVDVLDPRNADDRENLGQGLIAARLRAEGMAVRMLSLTIGEALACSGPPADGLYGFSFYSNTAEHVFACARRIKSMHPQARVCVGGRLASDAASEILDDCPDIDFVVLGEAHRVMPIIVKELRQGRGLEAFPWVFQRRAQPLARQVARGSDFSGQPWPTRDLLAESLRRGNRTARISATLGCAASCAFCSVNSFLPMPARERSNALVQLQAEQWKQASPQPRRRWQGRPVQDVFQEILWLNRNHGVRSFVFNDASFEDPGRAGKDRIRELCNRVLDHGQLLAFRCSMRSESFKERDAPLLDLMRRAGFTNVFLGIESGSDQDLDSYNKIAASGDNHAALRLFESRGIDVTTGFIMFHPDSTPQSLLQNHRFLVSHGVARAHHHMGRVEVYYGTALHARLRARGLLADGFSYRTPDAYRFTDPEVARLDGYLRAFREDPILLRHDGQIIHLGYTLSELKALFGEAATPPAQEFAAIRGRSAQALEDFFGTLFPTGDCEAANRRAPSFLREIEAVSESLKSWGLKLIYNRHFRGYLFGAARRAGLEANS